VTAVVNIAPDKSPRAHVEEATLSLYNPSGQEKVKIGGAQRPLAADLGAPSGYYPNPLLAGLYAMIRPGSYKERAGLYILEPYDPDQIPVVFIHGLLSIPQMWRPTIDAIQSDPSCGAGFSFGLSLIQPVTPSLCPRFGCEKASRGFTNFIRELKG
jgi:hypothetical protein